MIIATSTVQVLDVSLEEVGTEQQLMRIAPTCSSVQVTSGNQQVTVEDVIRHVM